ncbi:MAG: hypothetical protein IPK53_19505 [bacterium]|nr:hypothetical protein [bacterium]
MRATPPIWRRAMAPASGATWAQAPGVTVGKWGGFERMMKGGFGAAGWPWATGGGGDGRDQSGGRRAECG